MKVFYVNSYSCIGGAEKSLQSIMLGVRNKGIEPFFIGGEKGDLIDWCKEHNIKFYIVPQPSLTKGFILSRLIFFIFFNIKLFFLFLKERPRVIHTNTLRSRVYCWLFAKLPFIYSVAHIRDIEKIRFQSSLVNAFDSTIAISSAVKNSVVDGLSINSIKKVTVLYNAVADYTNLPASYAEEQSDKHFNIGMFGRFDDWKGQHLFINAAIQLLEEGLNVKFFIFGDAIRSEEISYKEKCLKLIPESASQCIRHVGFVSEPSRYMKSLNLIIVPSINEPFGRVVIEAISSRANLIASNGGGIPEILGPEGKSCLFKQGSVDSIVNKLREAYNDEIDFQRMNEVLYRRYREKFHIDKLIDSLVAIYK